MTITAEQSGLFAALRTAGASVDEAVIVLGVVDDLNEAIELAHSDAWRHELRGKGGKFASGGPRMSAQARHIQRAAAAARTRNRPRPGPMTTGGVPVQRTPEDLAAALKIPEVARINAASPTPLTPEHTTIGKMIHEVKQAHQDYVQSQDQEEKTKAHKKFLAVFTSLVLGVIASLAAAKFGAPDVATAFAGIGPAALESLYELKNRL
jgi:hypothetical protein